MKTKALMILGAAAVLTVVAVRAWRARSAVDSDAIRMSGTIEVTDVQVSFKIPGRMAERLVSEGQTIARDAVVARLETTDLEHELALRQADVEAAAATLADLRAGARPEELEQAEAAVAVAQAEAERAQREHTRQKELFDTRVISSREFEAAEAAWHVASARVREAEARLALLRRGAREDTVRAAGFRLEEARQAAALAETRLADATLTSPLDGVVLTQSAEAGEFVAPGTPIVTVAGLDRVWLRAYVGETDLGRVKLGQPVRVTADTFPGKVYDGRLSFIAQQAEFTPKNIQTTSERVKLVYRIKVDIANLAGELKPGMPADAEIRAE